jgi:hypothetical protein
MKSFNIVAMRKLTTISSLSSILNADTTHSKPLSNRAKFRQIIPDMHIINKLDTLDLGFCAKRRRRVSVAIKRRAMTGESKLNILYRYSNIFKKSYKLCLFYR